MEIYACAKPGRLVQQIGKGGWVNDQNLKSEQRNYDSELVRVGWQMCAVQSEGCQPSKPFQIWGYRRPRKLAPTFS